MMEKWTGEKIPDQSGKMIVVTGANSGLGFEISRVLAGKGALVVLACRSLERGRIALEKIQNEFPQADLDLRALDLASLESVRNFAQGYKEKYDRLDVLVNNGGPIVAGRALTEDGFESHFGVNHLGHFALTGLLLDVLLNTPSSRIVTVGSRMHAQAEIIWDDLTCEKKYDAQAAYGQSKLANMLFAFELARRLEAAGSTTRSIAAHPGLVKTNWAENNLDGLMKLVGKILSALTYQDTAVGALSPLYAATSPEAISGGYYGPENDTKGYPVVVKADERAYNEAGAARLWTLSENLTGVTFSL